MRTTTWGAALCVALGLVGFAATAHAGLLRCKGPDGKMIYTDNKALCPDAKPFKPQGEIQSSSPGRSERTAPASRSSTSERLDRARKRQKAFEAEEAEAQRWRDRKTGLRESLDKILERRAYYEKFVTLCNRGGSVMTRDDAGIKRRVKCSKIDSQYASLGEEADNVREQLAGLDEECRKSGCLPGWLR